METQTLTDVVNTASQMSMWNLVWASDMVTKVVMIGLIAASVWSWAIIIEKFGTLQCATLHDMQIAGYENPCHLIVEEIAKKLEELLAKDELHKHFNNNLQ